MRFALLGDHPDGLDMARALVETGRHELAVYSGPRGGAESLRRGNLRFQEVPDLEEVLADPAVEMVVVAGSPGQRPEQLRRALQSEHHVLCVQPVDITPDTGYEAAMIQGDTRQMLLPLLPEVLHPGTQRLAELAGQGKTSPAAGIGTLRLIEVERWSTDRVLSEAGSRRQKAALPGWDVLRSLGGEIAKVSALSSREEINPEEPLLLSGRFEQGGLFQVSFLSSQYESRWRLSLVGSFGRADLVFPQGWPGPAHLTWPGDAGDPCEEGFEAWNPWPALVEVFEGALSDAPANGRLRVSPRPAARAGSTAFQTGAPRATTVEEPTPFLPRLRWQDAVRSLELDDAARRSAEKRRASTMDYQEFTEEASFKGTMTLLGCSLLWGSLILLILANWVPWTGWLIAPLFGLFLILQVLRGVARK